MIIFSIQLRCVIFVVLVAIQNGFYMVIPLTYSVAIECAGKADSFIFSNPNQEGLCIIFMSLSNNSQSFAFRIVFVYFSMN